MSKATTQVVTEAPFPRPSSTVVLARAGDDGPELFMVRRPARASFGDVFVFPGGVLDDEDGAVHNACAGISEADANRLLHVDTGGLDYYSAAIRELFEEAGVLLADTGLAASELEEARDALNEGTLMWDRFVVDANVTLRCDALHYFSHWITPNVLPKRYSTRFFVAELPEGQHADYDRRELTASVWTTAADAIASSEVPLHFPTRRNMEPMVPCKSVEELIAWADDCAECGVEAVSPIPPPNTKLVS